MKTDDIFGKKGNGTLDVLVEENPDLDPWNYSESKFVNLDVSFWHDDFDAIYIDALQSKNLPISISEKDYFEPEPLEKNQAAFNEYFSEFQMLGSFDDMYKDYVFNSKRTEALLNECLEIRKLVISEEADRALRKMIYSCEKAIEKKFYLTFRCD